MSDTVNLMTIQITLKSQIGKTMPINIWLTEKELKLYKATMKESLEKIGFTVEGIAATWANTPVGVEIVPIPIPTVTKKKPEPIEPEPEIDLTQLEQYQGKPTLKK